MNRLRVLRQRAVRNGVFPMRSMESTKLWDIVDSCGPRGLELTKREAINLAGRIAVRKEKMRVYLSDIDGVWHRSSCEKVASQHAAPVHPCDCRRLDLNSSARTHG